MNKLKFVILLIFIVGCSSAKIENHNSSADVNYYIDLTDLSDDLFDVTVKTSGLTSENSIYHLPATAPGTYQIMDFGRFVTDIKGFDGNGNEIELQKLSSNSWHILEPENLAEIKYKIDDTFGSEIEGHPVAPMSGTGIEKDFVSINTYGVLGYFEGLQSNPIELKIEYDPNWKIGTSLESNDRGYFFAENYDHLADSPILLGELTLAETNVAEIPVEIYVYSPDSSINAQRILSMAEEVLQSSNQFVGFKAAPHYKFLMALIDQKTFADNKLYTAGALEHNLSSLYVLPMDENGLHNLRNIMAHEFLHILTPLNLHSEIIHTFNFIEPTPSQHVWLYEGVTEWASTITQLRGGVINYEEYLNDVTKKMRINDNFNQDVSLYEMSMSAYDEKGYSNFGNFYNKGALTAMCLDIELLELSDGRIGFREVFIQLLKEFGKNKPFPEEDFFDILVERTYPEVKIFIEKYILGSEPLPVASYLKKLGFSYQAEAESKDSRPGLGMSIGLDGEKLILVQVSDKAKEYGFRDGDQIMEIFGEGISISNIQSVINNFFAEKKVGDEYEIKVKRGDEILTLSGIFQTRTEKHVFSVDKDLTPEQSKLREAWSKNLL